MLPANEYNDRQRFKERLELFLARFSFRNTVLRVKLEKFLCRPEGGGLASIAVIRNGADWLQQRKLGVLMLGHRNVSALYFEYGSMKTLDSPLIGFSSFLDSVVAMTSGLERSALANALFTAIDAAGNQVYDYRYRNIYSYEGRINYTKHPNWGDYYSVKNLATAKDPTLRQQEIEAIVSAIESATEQYWSKLFKWLGKIFPDFLEIVIVSGGASRFLEPEIEEYFNCQPMGRKGDESEASYYDRCFEANEHQDLDSKYHMTPVVWSGGLQERVNSTFGLTNTSRSLSYRLIDAYGLFDYLLGKNSLNNLAALSKSKPDASASEEKNG